ncbi:adipocyte plasma membrane-associated protein-like [Uloborus diversus]|uniref:adipocyte plasma membrane-associated protein-like n=1 Tax=Uloborus diversus TaxID=327109 RepID=UPI0024092A7D|nr:adipocyte plasma membrane-associated protein-like [Uloborus diversus]XP_054718291.1 adipocyte plasma membrane-associated protein-like [Uloborus diversus]
MMWNFVIILVAVLVYVYLSPFFKKLDPVSYSVSLPDKLTGPLEPNEILDRTEKLFENTLHWPEAFAVWKDKIYTGLGDGRIVSISGNKMGVVCRTGTECAGQHEEHLCGRPLGMQFDKKGLLYVVDGYLGLLSVDVETGKKKVILPSSTLVNDKPLFFLNDLHLDEKENVIYLTQSSTRWNISMVIVSILEHDTSGRLLKFDLKTKQVTEVLPDLAFPNGVELSHKGDSLLVAEGNNHKIFKYYLSGPTKGQKTDLPLVLPGEPDNISRNKRGNYWVGLASCRSKENPTIYDRVSELPFLRQWFLHLHRLSTAPIRALLGVIPNKWANEVGFELQSGRIVADLPMSHGIIVEIDDNGKIIRSLQSPSGKVVHISEILEHNGYLYLGSWRNHYLGRLKL